MLTVLNAVSNCHDFMTVRLQHRSRSIASLTSKINKLVAEKKLIRLPSGSLELVQLYFPRFIPRIPMDVAKGEGVSSQRDKP